MSYLGRISTAPRHSSQQGGIPFCDVVCFKYLVGFLGL